MVAERMNVGNSVKKAIVDWSQGELEAAMLHACNAVDGTAKKAYPAISKVGARFTQLLRDNYAILGPMGAPGLDIANTRWQLKIKSTLGPGSKPDIVDIIYSIHRCCHGHGDELPRGFELLPDAAGPARHTRMRFSDTVVQMSDRMIFGLLAVAIMSPVNSDQQVPDGFYLTFSTVTLPINEWWGRAADFPAVAAQDPAPLVRIVFSSTKSAPASAAGGIAP